MYAAERRHGSLLPPERFSNLLHPKQPPKPSLPSPTSHPTLPLSPLPLLLPLLPLHSLPPTPNQIPLLLLRIHMPNNIIRQPPNPIPRSLRHSRKALRIGLILERVGGEIDAGAVDVGFDEDVDAADAVEGDEFVKVAEAFLLVGVGEPV